MKDESRRDFIKKSATAIAGITILPSYVVHDSAMDCPEAEISSEHIRAKIYLPDIEKGYYRATRFDWSGIIFSLEYNGHQFSGPWFDKYDPEIHDAICGPVDEFAPVGFDEAKIGDEFLKIGVGLLRKSSVDYQRFGLYQIVNPGKWQIIRENNRRIVFRQVLESASFSCVYTKTVSLADDKPVLMLDYSLKNTGKQALESNVYNHNFFVIDRHVTGPDTVIAFPFKPEGQWGNTENLALLHENKIRFTRNFQKGESVFMADVQGFNPEENYRFRIENHAAKAGVHITGNRPPLRIVFWASYLTACPEPYIRLSVNPQEEFTWSNCFELYDIR